jgi:hypothetical protein
MSEVRISIEREIDIIAARQAGRQLAGQLGFSSTDQTLIATAISEVARNILIYAVRGEIVSLRSPMDRATACRSSHPISGPASRTSSSRCAMATRRRTASASACPARGG